MGGIAGQIAFSGAQIEREIVERMLLKLAHRGQDEQALKMNKGVCIGNCRAKVFDQNEDINWSISTRDGRILMSYDGEVYNYRELRRMLSDKGYQFHTNSDAEVVLALYCEYGIEFIHKLDGIYAIAICDYTKNVTYLIRDILGVKPLFYYRKKDYLFFTSEIKALICPQIYTPQIDYFGLKDYLHMQLYLGNKTLFKDVSYVGEGAYLQIDLHTGKSREVKYWEMPQDELDISYKDAIECLDELIKKSVGDCCNVDGSIAAYISGGIDSSIVSTLTSKYFQKHRQDELYTYSSIYPNMDFQDEHVKSDAVANNLRSLHQRVVLDKQDMMQVHLDGLMYKLDMPEAGYAAPYMLMNRNTRKHSKVVLTGNGGDELFAGYPKYIAATLASNINRSYNGEISYIDSSSIKYAHGFEQQFKNILGCAVFQDQRELVKSLFYRTETIWGHINEDIRRETADYDVAQELLNISADRSGGPLKRLMYMDQKVLLKGLLHIEDRTSSTEGLASRAPLVSKEIVEFAARMPEGYLLKNGLKSMMRDVAKKHIPYEVAADRNKSGMIYPVPEFLTKYMKDQMNADVGMLDESELFTCPASSLSSLGDGQIYSRNTWGLWCIATWHKSFIG